MLKISIWHLELERERERERDCEEKKAKTGNAHCVPPFARKVMRIADFMAIFSQPCLPPSLAIASRTRTSAVRIALLKHRKIITSAIQCLSDNMPPTDGDGLKHHNGGLIELLY